MISRLAAVWLVAAVTGCGGDDVATPQQLAEKVGCTDFGADTTQEVFVKEVGTCQLDGQQIRLLTFNNPDGRKGFIDIATTMGGVYVYGDKWAVEAETESIADKVKDKAGGNLGPTG